MPDRLDFAHPWVKTLCKCDVLEAFSKLQFFCLKTLLTVPQPLHLIIILCLTVFRTSVFW